VKAHAQFNAVAKIALSMDMPISSRVLLKALNDAYESGYEDGERDTLADICDPPDCDDEPDPTLPLSAFAKG
jgi:hypothetical protein